MGKVITFLMGFCLFLSFLNGNVQATGVGDADGDGVPDAIDGCPTDPHKIGPGMNGCGKSDAGSLLIGGWWPGSNSTSPGEITSITFYPNGSYVFCQNGDPANPSMIGIEYGSYQINPINNELTVNILSDQNGQAGFSHPLGNMIIVGSNSNNLTIQNTAGGDLKLTRVIDANKSEVGSWWPGTNSPETGGIKSLTFYPNGTFIHCQNGDLTNPNLTGIEYGTYSIDLNTKAITSTILYDQNGLLGMSNPVGQPYLVVTGRKAVLSDNNSAVTWLRTAPTSNDKIGAYYQSNWYLDANNNGNWEWEHDIHAYFGSANMTPVVGDWNGDGRTKIGAYQNGAWYLDLNGNGAWDGESIDRMIPAFGGAPDDIPVVGDWNGDGITEIGVYRQGTTTWYLDYNGNGVYDAADISAWFGFSGCQPVVGDWNGDGRAKIGVYANAQWFLDTNGNLAWDGTPTDTIVSNYGFPGMVPVAGDWTGTGVSRIGGYYSGDWYLDIDGNGAWNPPTDQYLGPFGFLGAIPIVGKYHDPNEVIVHDPGVRSGSFVVSKISGNTTESGGTATFTIRLGSVPASNVTIPVSSSNLSEGTVDKSTLTFTTDNWQIDQTVTVTGVSDLLADGNVAYSIILGPTSSADSIYNGLHPADVAVTNLDIRSASFVISAISGNTSESGTIATFTVRLGSQPTANVTIPVSSSDLTEGTVSPSSLVFTNANWNTDQTVTVTGVSDGVEDGNVPYTIILGTTSSPDPLYNGLDPADVSLTNIGVSSGSGGSVLVSSLSGEVSENGTSATFTVTLGSQPTANVTIPISSSNTSEGTVSPASLTFTPANWNIPQVVTITGVSDNIEDGNQTFTIVLGAATSADSNYNGLDPADVSATNIDIVGVYSVTPAISAGNYHNLVLANDGSVWGWGSCESGQLDTNTICSPYTNTLPLPQKLNIGKAAAISAGYSFSAIVKRDGTVWTSGNNPYNQLGHANASSLAQVNGISNVKTVAAGTDHILALKNDGTVWAWGKGEAGQLGNGLKIRSAIPVQSLGGLAGQIITAIASGENHSLALDNNGIAYSWGTDNYEQLGRGTGDNSTPLPTAISTISGVSSIGAGQVQSFAVGTVDTALDVYGWGFNNDGQLGLTPDPPPTEENGYISTIAVPTGTDTFSSSLIPSQIDGSKYHSVALVNSTVYTWGDNDAGDATDNNIEGYDNRGALGLGTTSDVVSPTISSFSSNAIAVNAGANYTLVLLNDGRLQSSGKNNAGQLGTNEVDFGIGFYTTTPVYVEDPGDLGTGNSSYFYAYRPVLSGYPSTTSHNTSATVAVCAAPAHCGPITYYRYSTDSGGSWSSATSITIPISLTGLSAGQVSLWVKGMSDASTELQTNSSAAKISWLVN